VVSDFDAVGISDFVCCQKLAFFDLAFHAKRSHAIFGAVNKDVFGKQFHPPSRYLEYSAPRANRETITPNNKNKNIDKSSEGAFSCLEYISDEK